MPSDAQPRLISLATAVPPYVLRQADVAASGRMIFDGYPAGFARFADVYDHAGIATRYSCVPIEWYRRRHDWPERARLYLENALALMERAALEALERAGVAAPDIDIVVSVSSTGIATPSLDAHLLGRLGLRADVERLPIFGLGCAGGVLGMARAAALARARPGAHALLTVAETCGLTFRAQDMDKSNIVATALFGDGAVAAVLSTAGAGPRLVGWGEHTWPGSLDVMGWRIEEDGFGVLFSRDIPTIVRREFRAAAEAFLARRGLDIADVAGWICHPGGAKVLAALENALGLDAHALDHSRAILRDYGNMSAPTALFVLERALKGGAHGWQLVSALGPGFSAGFVLIDA